MRMEILSLLLLLVVIILGFLRKTNMGILAFAVGAIAVRFFGLTDKILIGCINVSLFVTLFGITLLFTIVKKTGALELLAQKIISAAGQKIYLIPVLIYLAGFLISVIGPGGVPALAIIPPLAVAIAIQCGYSPLMLALIGVAGMTVGRFSPIAPEGLVIIEAATKANMTVNPIPAIIFSSFIVNTCVSLFLYIVFKGYKVKPSSQSFEFSSSEKFNGKQIAAFCGVLAMLVLIIFVGVNIGIAALSVSAVLLLFNVCDDKNYLSSLPWGTIVMIMGMGALLSIINKMGGIELLNNALRSIMSERTAVPLMGVFASLMSLFSSALGVVYPTLMPMCADLASQIGGVNPCAMMSAVALGGALSGLSPFSTGGALVMAAITCVGQFSSETNKIFVQLIAFAVISIFVLIVLSMLFFNVIANTLCPIP